MKRIITGIENKMKESNGYNPLFESYYMHDMGSRERDEINIKTGEIYPTNYAPVLIMNNGSIEPVIFKWGYPGFKNNNVIINARSESVNEKRMFRDSIISRRCVIPANGFFEWNKVGKKKKYYFTRKDSDMLYMAGIYNQYEKENRFVILTIAANDSMKEIHSRMPLVLENDRLEEWLSTNETYYNVLNNIPPMLNKRQIDEDGTKEYEQLELNL